MDEASFLFGLAASRLRSRSRWGGIVLALSLLVPYEVIDDRPRFLWEILSELPATGVAGAFAPTAAGIAILIASWLCRRATSLAVAIVAALGGMVALTAMGADASAWDVLALPESLTRRSAPFVLALSLTTAGVDLTYRQHAKRAATVVLAGAVGSTVLFYLWPARGEAPAMTAIRAFSQIGHLPGWRFVLGLFIVGLFLLWPAIMSPIGVLHLFFPPKREQPIAGIVAIFGLPAMMLMLVYRSLLGAQGAAGIFAGLGGIVVLAALLALTAAAVEVLGEALVIAEQDRDEPPGMPLRVAALSAAGAVVVLGAAQWLLARPPEKGITWALREPTPQGERLFGTLLIRWSNARLQWDEHVRHDSSATEMVELRAAARELVAAARELDARLGDALAVLTREGDDLDVPGRRWHHLMADVNDAARRSGLPYYADPRVGLRTSAKGLQRHFHIDTYRLHDVHRFLVDGKRFATLHVRTLGRGGGVQLMGFSRDIQPFALVVLDEVESYEAELDGYASEDPSTCGASQDPDARVGLVRCGQLVRTMFDAMPARVGAAILEATERHELQHQIDGPHLPMAGAVLQQLGGYGIEARQRVNREISGYLAEMTAPGVAPRLGLVHLARLALLYDRGPERQIGVIGIEELTGRSLRGARGLDDRRLVADGLAELAKLGDDDLRSRAARAWERLFGTRLPKLRRD